MLLKNDYIAVQKKKRKKILNWKKSEKLQNYYYSNCVRSEPKMEIENKT